MALGTKDFLSLSDERDGDRSLPLNVLLSLLRVLCSGWWTLSKMVCKPTQLSVLVKPTIQSHTHTHTHTYTHTHTHTITCTHTHTRTHTHTHAHTHTLPIVVMSE